MSREALRQRSDFVGAHRVLTAAAALAGQAAVAKSALADLRVAQPGISLDWINEQMPCESDIDRQHYLKGFRAAGLS